MHDKKDFSECKNWLKSTHPDLHDQIYPEQEGGDEAATEENKGAGGKKKKKVGISLGAPQAVKVYKSKRGNKKAICNVVGLQSYGVNLKDAAKLMSKKFACSATVANDEKYGECIQL
jgi:translation initiation factor 1 (eIF-1/SUI1)